MSTMQFIQVVITLLTLCHVGKIRSKPAAANSVPMKLVNNAGAAVELFWVNINADEHEDSLLLQTVKPLRHGAETNVRVFYSILFLENDHKSIFPKISKLQ
jgi:hypothetical protein